MNKWEKMTEYVAQEETPCKERLVLYTEFIARVILKVEAFDFVRFANEVQSRIPRTSDIETNL